MFRKTQIVSLILLFFISTTGLPAYYHYCEMMGKRSLSECEACKAKIENIESSCCSNETPEYPVTISSDQPVCCQDAFVYNKVEDQFLFNKSEINYFTSTQILFHSVSLITPSVDFLLENSFYCDSSPPFLINPELNISNSVLLI
jgi:hypothetical protein